MLVHIRIYKHVDKEVSCVIPEVNLNNSLHAGDETREWPSQALCPWETSPEQGCQWPHITD